jgi:ribosome-associated toxin RatA of RatAB toxin-antitoxin module
MPTVRKSALVAHPPEAMFELVDDVEAYPRFLPWCASTEVHERTAHMTRARLDIAYGGLRTHITTRNTKDPPHGMTLDFVEGPFERFQGRWRFVALGDAGCRVEFSLEYALASAPLRALLGPLFGHVADTMVERFVERADVLYPPAPGKAR